MIIKQAVSKSQSSDPRVRAGNEAEERLAFYLHRAYAIDPDLLVLNDLRLVDPSQRESDGKDGVCQIDHLVLHRWGAFVIESKSVTDTVTVRDDGAGGDEWTRRYGGHDHGLPSPIQQAGRQCAFLRNFLAHHKQDLLGKQPRGIRAVSRLVAGTDQRGFRHMPMQIIVAISDNGKIHRVNDWQAPAEPFRTFVSKADLVPDKVRGEFEKHQAAGGLLSGSGGEYGLWTMKPEELAAVAGFLVERHTPSKRSGHARAAIDRSKELGSGPRSEPAPARGVLTTAACKACGGSKLTAKWGRYGYYWACSDCNTNTTIPMVCSVCGTEGRRGESVRIRKEGPGFYRSCAECGIEERVWTNT